MVEVVRFRTPSQFQKEEICNIHRFNKHPTAITERHYWMHLFSARFWHSDALAPACRYPFFRKHLGLSHQRLRVAGVEGRKGVGLVCSAPPQLHLPPHVRIHVLAMSAAKNIEIGPGLLVLMLSTVF